MQGDGRVVAASDSLIRFQNDSGIGAGELEFVSAQYTVKETDSSLTVAIRRVGGSKGVVVVPYATRDGTAVAGTNYVARSGALMFRDGDTNTQAITIPILTTPEPREIWNSALAWENQPEARLGEQLPRRLYPSWKPTPRSYLPPPTIGSVRTAVIRP
jgi:hypothetical protein